MGTSEGKEWMRDESEMKSGQRLTFSFLFTGKPFNRAWTPGPLLLRERDRREPARGQL